MDGQFLQWSVGHMYDSDEIVLPDQTIIVGKHLQGILGAKGPRAKGKQKRSQHNCLRAALTLRDLLPTGCRGHAFYKALHFRFVVYVMSVTESRCAAHRRTRRKTRANATESGDEHGGAKSAIR